MTPHPASLASAQQSQALPLACDTQHSSQGFLVLDGARLPDSTANTADGRACVLAATHDRQSPQPGPLHSAGWGQNHARVAASASSPGPSPAHRPQQPGLDPRAAPGANQHRGLQAAAAAGPPAKSPMPAAQELGAPALSTRSLQSQRSLKGLKSMQARRRQEAALEAIVAKYT